MIILNTFTNSVPMSLNQYNIENNIGNLSGLDKSKWHYVFKITNDLDGSNFIFYPFLSGSYSNAGDLYHSTTKSLRMNEFRWIISPTQSQLNNGKICFTASNWDDGQWAYEAWVQWGIATQSGTPSLSNIGNTASILLEEGRIYFTI